MDSLRQLITHLTADGVSADSELIDLVEKVAPDASSCPMELVRKLVKLGEASNIARASAKVKTVSDYDAKFKSLERANQAAANERDRVQKDLNKQILLKDKLEELCRTLQKEKKKIEEESNARLRLEDAKRKEFADKVTESINQLKQQISANQEQQQQLCEENISLTEKLGKSLEVAKHHEKALEKYEEREQTFAKLIEAKDEERKILSQKYENSLKLMQEIHKAEIEKFKAETDELHSQRKTFEDTFIEQAKTYDQKFSQMNLLVTESQQTIAKYKKEMSEVTKFVSKLHADAVKSKETIQRLDNERKQLLNANESLKKKLKALENLCRKLQSDRKTLVSICKTNNLSEEVEKQLAAPENVAPSDSDEAAQRSLESAVLSSLNISSEVAMPEPAANQIKDESAIVSPDEISGSS